MSRPFAVVDTETTGLDPRIHQPFEACIWHERHADPITFVLGHDLEYADPKALEINHYHDRGFYPFVEQNDDETKIQVAQMLTDVTLVGANPAFDAAMLTRYLGYAPWHHRLTNVSEAARWVFDWEEQYGLAVISDELGHRGYNIPKPDHTAEGDVRATRAIYAALLVERKNLVRVQ